MHISLAPEILFTVGGISITNSLFTAFIIFFLIIFLFAFVNANLKYKNPSKFQLLIEMIVEGLFGLSKSILGEKKSRNLFGFLFTFFIFIFASNWFGLLPFVPATVIGTKGASESAVHASASVFPVVRAKATSEEEVVSVNTDTLNKKEEDLSLGSCLGTKDCFLTTDGITRFEEEKHLFRAPTSDLSMTVAFALIAVIVVNGLGFSALKGKYIKKYFNFTNPIDGFVGILELVSEIGKIISFSFRLFGNVFAGEVLLAVITSITYGIATLPFLGLELFVGIIQGLVFFMLTAVLIGLATTPHGGHDEHKHTGLEELPLSP